VASGGVPLRERSAGAPDRALVRRALVAAATLVLVVVGSMWAAYRRPLLDGNLVAVTALRNPTGYQTYGPLANRATDWVARSVADVVESPAMAPRQVARVVRQDRPSLSQRFGLAGRPATVIAGEVHFDGVGPQLHVRVMDMRRGGRAWIIPPISVQTAAPESAIDELGERATGAVMVLLNPGQAEWFPVASTPPTYQAYTEYMRGFSAARPWDAGAHFARAAELDSTFTWALLEAASPGRMLDRSRAHDLVQELEAKRSQLNRLQNAVLSSLSAMEDGDRQGHHQAMAVAAQLAPRRFLMDYAASARSLNRPRLSLDLLDRVDAQLPQTRLASTWSFRTDLLHQLGRYDEELALTRSAREILPLDMNILAKLVRARAAVGEVKAVLALVDTALSLPNPGQHTAGALMLGAAQELRAHGHLEPSLEMAQRAVDWYKAMPAAFTNRTSWHEIYLAAGLYQGGKLDEAQAMYEELLRKDPSWRIGYYGSLGAIAARKGDSEAAEKYIRAISDLEVPADGEAYEVGMERARIAVLLGDAERALVYLREGYRGGQGADLHADLDFETVLANDPGFQEFVRPKG
jgi:tetratricopeptide (TPR) repeat protein